MTASRLVRVTILVALFFLAATRLFAGPITPVVTIKTVADTSSSRLKYALVRGTFRSRYNPTENGFAEVKASLPGKDMIKNT
jgi:hypothetical protein